MSNRDLITREQARALITEHGVVALERGHDLGLTKYEERYESDHNQFFRLGNGRLLWRQDSDDQYGEEWELVVETIDATATEAPREIGG